MKTKMGLFAVVLVTIAVAVGFGIQGEIKPRTKVAGISDETMTRIVSEIKETSAPPMGVSPDHWISLTTNAGIVLKPTKNNPNGKTIYTGTVMFRESTKSSRNEVVLGNPINQSR